MTARRALGAAVTLASFAACSSPVAPPDDAPLADVQDAVETVDLDAPTEASLPDLVVPDVPPPDVTAGDSSAPTWCSIGTPIDGAVLPGGYCIRRFAGPPMVREPRTLAFAPNGDLFVGAPVSPGAGGGTGGPGALYVLSDDDRDGVAEVHTFLSGVTDIHGIAIAPDAIYFTTLNAVMRTPYVTGQRTGTGMTMVATIPNPGRFTHGLARTPGGTLYVTNGARAYTCPDTGSGWIDEVMPDGSLQTMADGFRNPMYMRCHFADEACFATELGDDGGGAWGAREKLLWIHPATHYGYPCCAGANVTAPSNTAGVSCAMTTVEEAQFPINQTPFGLDWERGVWASGLYRNAMFVAKHGSFYSSPSWQGAGIFFAPTDPTTHAPSGPFEQFVGGFGPGGSELERPCDLTFAPDGRMFFSDDMGNGIYWIAPMDLHM